MAEPKDSEQKKKTVKMIKAQLVFYDIAQTRTVSDAATDPLAIGGHIATSQVHAQPDQEKA